MGERGRGKGRKKEERQGEIRWTGVGAGSKTACLLGQHPSDSPAAGDRVGRQYLLVVGHDETSRAHDGAVQVPHRVVVGHRVANVVGEARLVK